MGALNLAQKLDEAERVDLLDGENLRLAGFRIDGAVDIEPLTARRLLHRDGDILAGPAARPASPDGSDEPHRRR